jgi:hypothetical protein
MTLSGSNPAAVPLLATLTCLLLACGPDAELDLEQARATGSEEEEVVELSEAPLTAGVNGDACMHSPFNCKLRVSGGNRVQTNDPHDDDSWAVLTGGHLRNGHGQIVAQQTGNRLKFNYGQVRSFAGEPHAFAMSNSNLSSGWYPISAIHGHDSFVNKVGKVSARSPANAKKLGCYQIRNSHDASKELKKVVYDSTAVHERAGDYMSLPRKNGERSANLCFNTPGFGLGGVAVDHFPHGTRFQRLDVPTSSGVPSIDVPLWVQDDAGRYRKRSGSQKFVYGYVIAQTGTRRVGWMALDALAASSGCP